MKNIKCCTSSLFYGLLGSGVILALLYWGFSSKYSFQNPLALSINTPDKCVILKGKLILKRFPGPPEYSSIKDGDRVDYCWILKVDEASFLTATTTPVAEPANTLDNITRWTNPDEMLLVLDGNTEKLCWKYQNQEVLSEGYLFHAHTVHHYTPILMDVKEMKVTLLSSMVH